MYEIKPKVPYTEKDLDWQDKNSRTTKEMADHKSRPEIADKDAKIDLYDTILLVFPIWWYVAPTIVNTFLEAYDFKGKTIVIYPTSGESKFGKTIEELKVSVDKSCTIKEGKVSHGKATKEDVQNWVKEL